jgi:hypothetical protein
MFLVHICLFVWFYGAPTQFSSFGAATKQLTLLILGVTNLKQQQGSKTSLPI